MKSMEEAYKQPWAMYRNGLAGQCCNARCPEITVDYRCAAPVNVPVDEDGRCPVWRELQAKTAAEVTQTPDAETLWMLLRLVNVADIPKFIVDCWSEKERRDVADYVGAVHLKASDNDDVKVPPVPEVLKKYRRDTA